MNKKPQSRKDVPWNKRREIPDLQILDAAAQYEKACKLLAQQPPGSGVILPLMNTAAMAIELYLKCLSAELIYIQDISMPEASYVYSAPTNTKKNGHRLVTLLNLIPTDIQDLLIAAFSTEFKNYINKNIRRVLEEFEGSFMETRYPFEYKADITRYNHKFLLEFADFLGRFVRSLPPIDRFE
jgi:hypothetical protein